VVCRNLCEMNADVNGDYIIGNVDKLLSDGAFMIHFCFCNLTTG